MRPPSRALLLHCRAGLESDAAAEISAHGNEAGIHGYCRARPGSALVEFVPRSPEALTMWLQQVDPGALIFARQWLAVFAELHELPESDRLTPLLAALDEVGQPWRKFLMEYPDTNEGKQLSRFCRRFKRPLGATLEHHGLLQPDSHLRLHLLWHDSSSLRLGWSLPETASPWPMGIPRLRLSREAPSRSALKIEEALNTLLDAGERDRYLQAGMQAADLGAAPGGWSWHLARRGLYVTAVDNGPLADSALATELITHVRADGFTWRPDKPVDWLVCDMVDKPARVIDLVAHWFRRSECRHALFNLKLPMKQRFAAINDYLQRLEQISGEALVIRCKQLYHDREEVTVYATLTD